MRPLTRGAKEMKDGEEDDDDPEDDLYSGSSEDDEEDDIPPELVQVEVDKYHAYHTKECDLRIYDDDDDDDGPPDLVQVDTAEEKRLASLVGIDSTPYLEEGRDIRDNNDEKTAHYDAVLKLTADQVKVVWTHFDKSPDAVTEIVPEK
jgi:hypothetical protein